MHNGVAHNTSVEGFNSFMDWQTSDWLELDTSVYSNTRAIPKITAG
jgi:hypothetical protein